jgi:hypothetical protein
MAWEKCQRRRRHLTRPDSEASAPIKRQKVRWVKRLSRLIEGKRRPLQIKQKDRSVHIEKAEKKTFSECGRSCDVSFIVCKWEL